jgi:carboxylesterase type B
MKAVSRILSSNYRLNTFGFVSFRPVIPNTLKTDVLQLSSVDQPPEDLNAGLLDQRMALIFVQDNIVAFGGDPSKVSITSVVLSLH